MKRLLLLSILFAGCSEGEDAAQAAGANSVFILANIGGTLQLLWRDIDTGEGNIVETYGERPDVRGGYYDKERQLFFVVLPDRILQTNLIDGSTRAIVDSGMFPPETSFIAAY